MSHCQSSTKHVDVDLSAETSRLVYHGNYDASVAEDERCLSQLQIMKFINWCQIMPEKYFPAEDSEYHMA